MNFLLLALLGAAGELLGAGVLRDSGKQVIPGVETGVDCLLG